MGQKVTIGGQRLGAGGERIQQDINHYYRSTHDLSESVVTSMACGTLTPFVVKPMLRGDVMEIDTDAAARTIPTKGPLFGSYKLQGDYFFCPVRLYQALLHNNPVDIAMDMDKVMLPTITISTKRGASEDDVLYGGFSLSSLMKYTGLSGLGRAANPEMETMTRSIMCIPQLAYYDIYKNYYANKQEESGKVLSISTTMEGTLEVNVLANININSGTTNIDDYNYSYTGVQGVAIPAEGTEIIVSKPENYSKDWNAEEIEIYVSYMGQHDGKTSEILKLTDLIPNASGTILYDINNEGTAVVISLNKGVKLFNVQLAFFGIITNKPINLNSKGLEILDFPLKNLDDMRYALLTHHELGVPFKIGQGNTNNWNETSGKSGDGLPYSTLFNRDFEGKTANKYPMNGLCLKTYQNDIYNIWLNSELIDGENGVNNKAKVSVSEGSFSINSLLYAQKLFDLYNRIAVSDGSYDGWLNMVYEQEDRISHEKPLYLGGFYNEIVFEEIVQSAPAGGDPLGELGGKGTLVQKTEGGKIVIKASEPGFLIGIASITPRIYYTQQNEFYLTDIFSMDDFHKPELDQIGFQDLIGERLNFADTVIAGNQVVHRSKIGKLPAWLEYQTSVDKAYGDLAEPNGNGYMILNRNYEVDENGILDATTYIDPTKYNYAFAYQALDSQNFWIQVKMKNTSRRLMSANLLPNL